MGNTCASKEATHGQKPPSITTSATTTKDNNVLHLIVGFLADTQWDTPPIELFERVESFVVNVTGAPRSRAFLVSHKHRKLFHFVRSERANGEEVSAQEIGNLASFDFQTNNPNLMKALTLILPINHVCLFFLISLTLINYCPPCSYHL